MSNPKIHNLNIASLRLLISPQELRDRLGVSPELAEQIARHRKTIVNILRGDDKRFLVIVGPCSIHDPEAAIDYANRLISLHHQFSNRLFIVMRVYFEKPRTTIGWKGLINDPDLDGTCNMPKGLEIARKLLLDINEIGLPAATEVLDPISPQYISDLVSWASIGARTTESQTHREMASGLSMPVGFKNGTDGSLDVAIAAMQAAKHPHSFIGINKDGHTCVVRTKGNPWGHLILRGGRTAPNYKPESLERASQKLAENKLPSGLLIDCSHANSGKKYQKQELVLNNVVKQYQEGNRNIIGVMLESNIGPGNQPIPKDLGELQYGVSVTDECLDWTTTERLLTELGKKLK